MGSLYVKGVTNYSLFVHRCTCGGLTVHGFWHQVTKEFDKKRRLVTVRLPCEHCDLVRVKTYGLTTGKGRKRLFYWYDLFFKVARWIPNFLWKRVVSLVIMLEVRYPL